jgi:hypothetical protein
MLGEPQVRYVEKKCVRCGKVHHPETYHQLVPPQGNYAFDLIVAVGLARFRQHRQNGEIQAELRSRYGLRLPCSTINELAHAFLDGLAATHQTRAAELRKRLDEDGGTCFTWMAPANRAPTPCSTSWRAIAAGPWRARR